MGYCLNPDCPQPQNLETATQCQACGFTLLLRQRYRAIAPLGYGGFGRTFLSVDEAQSHRPRCVIKQFFPAAQSARTLKKALALFEQEAERLDQLGHHSQIPALLDHFTQEHRHYLILEFINGKNLEEALALQGAFSESQIRSVLKSLLPVLEFIHSKDVIHRDIKPANVLMAAPIALSPANSPSFEWDLIQDLLTHESVQHFSNVRVPSRLYRFGQFLEQSLLSVPKSWVIADFRLCQEMASFFADYKSLSPAQRQYVVANATRLLYELRRKYGQEPPVPAPDLNLDPLVLVDFGAAKLVTGMTMMTGTTIGSPEYLAPEQARGKALFASDLYSLGVTCLHLLTHTSPLDLFDIHEDTWVWRRYLPQPVSEPFAEILDKLVCPGVNRRYRSASAVLQDVMALEKESVPVTLSKTPSLPNPQTPPRSQPPTPAVPKSPVPEPSAPLPKPPTVFPQSWQCLHQLTNPGKLYAIAVSPTEPILASTSGPTVKLWNLETGKLLRTLKGHVDLVLSLAISPDGKTVISGSADKSIAFWEIHTGKRLGSLTLHTDSVLAIALSADGKLLATSSFYDPVMVWNLHAGREYERIYGHERRVDTLMFSPDSGLLASGSEDTTIKVWNVQTHEEVRHLQGHTDTVRTLAFTPDGKTLASGSADGSVRLWSTTTWRQKRAIAPPATASQINAVVFDAQGKQFFTASGDRLQAWNTRTGKEIHQFPRPGRAIARLAITEQRLVSAAIDGSIWVWQTLA